MSDITADSEGRPSSRLPRIPPNMFSIPFGLAGLGGAWRAGAHLLRIPAAVPDSIFILAAAVWLVLTAAYLQGPAQVLEDWRDPVLSPFITLAVIVPEILSAALSAVAFPAGRVLVLIFLGLTVILGGWLTGEWIARHMNPDSAHPGYFLPTVAGGFVGAYASAAVHLHAVAEASFGLGILSWLLLSSIMLNRLFFRAALPPQLTPTLAIELAPPVLAGIAFFAVSGAGIDLAACAFGGYAVLMAIVQLRLVPIYARLKFTPGF